MIYPQYYVLIVWDDIEPRIFGPYLTEDERDKKAKSLRDEEGDNHGIYWIDINSTGSVPETGAYSHSFFMKDIVCAFVSTWENGEVLHSRTYYDPDEETFVVLHHYPDAERGCLISEHLEFHDGTILPICPECHEAILKTVMEESEADPHTLIETQQCSICKESLCQPQ